jgi:hypothetical protein
MLVFIIPLKSPKVASSWQLVTQLFERCIRSVCQQNSPDFKAIVVCNEKPKINFSHPNLIFIEQNFPIPDANYPAKEFDRTRKIVTGILRAKELGATHIMAVDADDCVSKYLTQFVIDRSQKPGWIIKRGYYYQEGNKLIRIMRKGFDSYCGTSTIVRTDLYNFDKMSDRDVLCNIFYKHYRHREIQKTIEEKGFRLEPLPFEGAIYITDNGENIYHGVETKTHKISLKSRVLRLKAILDNRLITPDLREQFGLYALADFKTEVTSN